MSEDKNNTADDASTNDGEITDAEKLDMLKTKAKAIGLTFSGNIGADALRAKINEKLAADEADISEDEGEAKPISEVARKVQLRQDMKREQTKLVRVRITNLNPQKRELYGEIFTVGNKYIGTVRKFIPYGEATDEGYHIPMIIYNQLKSRKFQSIKTKQNKANGNIDITSRWVNEFALEILPPLDESGLKTLATNQAAAAGMAE